jgi:hypothetical protein
MGDSGSPAFQMGSLDPGISDNDMNGQLVNAKLLAISLTKANGRYLANEVLMIHTHHVRLRASWHEPPIACPLQHDVDLR